MQGNILFFSFFLKNPFHFQNFLYLCIVSKKTFALQMNSIPHPMNSAMKRCILLCLLAMMTLAVAAQRQLYISASGDDSNDGLSAENPWKTFNKVLQNLQAGDVVNIMPGTYSAQNTYAPLVNLKSSHSGTADRYITFRAYNPNNRPKFTAGGKGVWQCVNINASYVVFDGIEMEGNNQKLDSLAADNISKDYKNHSWNDLAVYNTNGISIGGGGSSGSLPHHVVIRNCIVHDFPGCGIGGQVADYLTFENNEVYNNAWFTMYACSGISILTPFNYDDLEGYHNRVVGNTVYNNHTKIKWYTSSTPRFSDGNGIIIDVNMTPDGGAPQEVKDDGAYRAMTLVANNVCYFNGGSGIHAFKAQHVDIINNTAYMNEQRYTDGYGEIFSQSGNNNRIVNNIMYAKANGSCVNYGSNGGAMFANNVCFNGSLHGASGNFKEADPLFLHSPTLPADKADFHIPLDSPAAGFGVFQDFMPETDKDGQPRTLRIDAGAFQAIDASAIFLPSVRCAPGGSPRYNLWGQRVSAGYAGIVISNGKKHLFK